MSCVLQSQAPRKKKKIETLLRLETGRGCPALGSQVKSGATATMQYTAGVLPSDLVRPSMQSEVWEASCESRPHPHPGKVWKCSSLSTYTQWRKGRRFF